MYARTMTAAVLLLSLAIGFGVQSPPAPIDANLVRVYVGTDDGGHPSELAARRESAKHLIAALAGKKKALAIVDDEDNADVVVEVIDRGLTVPRIVFGSATATGGGNPGPAAPPTRVVQLRVTASAGSAVDPIEVKNKNRPVESEPGWKAAADDVAKQVEKWIADHRARILAARRS